MHDHGFRHIADFVSEGAQSPAQVHILPVHEDPLVKTTQPLIDLASYGEGGAAAPLCFLCHRVVDLGMFVGELSQFPHRRIFIRLFYCFHKFRKCGVQYLRVYIKETYDIGAAISEAQVIPSAESQVLPGFNDLESPEVSFQFCFCLTEFLYSIVCGSVIHHIHVYFFQVEVCGPQQ